MASIRRTPRFWAGLVECFKARASRLHCLVNPASRELVRAARRRHTPVGRNTALRDERWVRLVGVPVR